MSQKKHTGDPLPAVILDAHGFPVSTAPKNPARTTRRKIVCPVCFDSATPYAQATTTGGLMLFCPLCTARTFLAADSPALRLVKLWQFALEDTDVRDYMMATVLSQDDGSIQ